MRFLACLFGWLFALATLVVAAWEVFAPDPAAGVRLRPAGELWYGLDAASLNLVQAVIERYVWPPLWDPVIAGLLQLPAVLLCAGAAALFVALCHAWRLRRRGKRFFR